LGAKGDDDVASGTERFSFRVRDRDALVNTGRVQYFSCPTCSACNLWKNWKDASHTTTSHNETTSTSLITVSPQGVTALASEDQENARLQNIWDGHCTEPRSYKSIITALLISWDEESNGLETEKEVRLALCLSAAVAHYDL